MPVSKVVIVSLAIAVASIPIWVAWEYSRPYAPIETFDRHAWLARNYLVTIPGDPGCVRGGMALDLIDRKSLVGNLASDITNLLGEPTKKGASWSYDLGQCSDFGWNGSNIVITFDDRSRVSKVDFLRAQ